MTTDENELNTNELKQQREYQQLSIDEVCDKLKLTRDAIEKLESSDFLNLGAYTYVRGYMQNYAQLLGLDIQKYIDIIPKESFESKIVNTYSKSEKLVKFKRQSKGFGNYAVGTFMVLAVSLTGWYFLKQYSVSKSRTLDLNANTTLEIEKPDVLELPNKTDNYHYSSLIPSSENSLLESNSKSDVEITSNEVRTDGSCPDSYVLTRTWTATDNCGNTATQSQVITVIDDESPALSGVPADISGG